MEPVSKFGSKCQSCNVLFSPSVNNRGRQSFCGKGACVKAAKALSNLRWRRKNPGYDSGPEQVARVQAWRARNPDYNKGKKRPKPPVALQDFASTQGVDSKAVTEFAAPAQSVFAQRAPDAPAAESGNSVALQDFAPIQLLLVVGLISVVFGDALQENFVTYRRELVERGRRVLACNPDGLLA